MILQEIFSNLSDAECWWMLLKHMEKPGQLFVEEREVRFRKESFFFFLHRSISTVVRSVKKKGNFFQILATKKKAIRVWKNTLQPELKGSMAKFSCFLGSYTGENLHFKSTSWWWGTPMTLGFVPFLLQQGMLNVQRSCSPLSQFCFRSMVKVFCWVRIVTCLWKPLCC